MSVDHLAQGDDAVSNYLVLPIIKFSYVTAAVERTSPLGWTHLSGGGNLVAIFDHVRTRELPSGLAKERRRLHVRRGTENLVCPGFLACGCHLTLTFWVSRRNWTWGF